MRGWYDQPTMQTATESVRDLLKQLPNSASLEDIQYHIYVRNKIERGIRDLKAGRTIPHEQVERRMKRWLGK